MGQKLGSQLINNNIYLLNFLDLQNTSAISQAKSPPFTRLESGVGYKDDAAHQRGLQILIKRKLITPGTLILSDSGHDIPLAAQLLKNSELKAQAIFYLPLALYFSSGTNYRLERQAQSWAEDIFYAQQKTISQTPNILFIGLEGHRREYDHSFIYRVPQNLLPTKKELAHLNITKIVYITEAHPDNKKVELKVLDDLKDYLKSIQLPIEYLGVDCRRDDGC